MANAPKNVRQSTKATVSTVISTVLVPGFAISTKKQYNKKQSSKYTA